MKRRHEPAKQVVWARYEKDDGELPSQAWDQLQPILVFPTAPAGAVAGSGKG